MSARSRLVVLISGSGSNLQAVMDACRTGQINAQVTAVLSNKASAFGLERARTVGIPALAVVKPRELDRRLYDQRLADQVASFQPDWVVLAGWMRLLSSAFLDRFPGKVINLHPALPGTFPGVNAIEQAYQAFQQGQITHTGVMVHLVPDEGIDCGPCLGQVVVGMVKGDSLSAVEERIHAAEHALLVTVLQKLTSSGMQ